MAEKLPSGKYRAKAFYYDETGKRRSRSFTAKTKREADYLAAAFSLEHRKNVAAITVSQAVDKLIELNDSVYSPSTIRGYMKIKRNWMDDILDLKMDEITDEILQRWINNLAKRYSPKTVICAYGLFQSCRSQFMPDRYFHVRLPKKEKKEIHIPQTQDVNRIIEETKGSNLYLPVLLGAHCGLRRSEMSALSWDDIDLQKRTITVRSAMVQGDDNLWHLKKPKSYAGFRTLDMSDQIYAYLSKADRSMPPVSLNPNSITKGFRTTCQKLGIQFNEHLLRHYFCSVCCNLGIPEAITIRLMGHHDSAMVRDVYGHVLNDFEDNARRSIKRFFNGAKMK